MEYVQAPLVTLQNVLCCECGTPTLPNPSNMCVGCIRSRVDITDGIQKQAYLQFCKGCARYLQPPNSWVVCELESRELLAVCLKRLKGLAKVHLIDAGFVWTEPHSKRIKVKLTIQKEVLGATILQQTFVVEFIVQSQMCDVCHRREAKDFWRAVVQVRQKVSHKKTFFYLEQLLLKHNAHGHCLKIKQAHDGLDFYYAKKDEARKLVDFLMSVVPCRYKTSEQLISHDVHNNTYNYKHTFSVEVAPICKDDIVCLPLKLARSLGNIGQIVVCYRVTNTLYLVDPSTLQIAELSASAYWRSPFPSLCNYKHLTEYTILEVERQSLDGRSARNPAGKFGLADVYLMRTASMGTEEEQTHCRTHLAHIVTTGDSVLGFDFKNSNVNNEILNSLSSDRIPDVVLVKKNYGDRKKRSKRRNWKLRDLPKENEAHGDNTDRDYNDFLEDLEEDKDYRQHVNIYKALHSNSESLDSSEFPRIAVEEMLEDLTLEDQDMASDSD